MRTRKFSFSSAERAGFEPAVPFPVHTLSRRANSTTLAPFRRHNIRLQGVTLSVVFGYYQAGANDKANALAVKLFDNYENNIKYIYSLDRDQIANYGSELKQAQGILEQLVSFANFFKQEKLGKEFEDRYVKAIQDYSLPTPQRGRPR